MTTNLTRTRIINDWAPETRSLLKTLTKHGLTILAVDNGEYTTKRAGITLAKFVEECMACDDAWLRVQTPDGAKKTIYLVYGNSPGELPADYSVCDLIDAATDEHYNRWDGRAQPTKEAA
jgi:hypothetical protein